MLLISRCSKSNIQIRRDIVFIIFKSDLKSKQKQIYRIHLEFIFVEQVPHNFLQASFAGPLPL